MMKFSVAFMVLLHACLSFSLSMNLNKELIAGLENLNVNYSALPPIHVPSYKMQRNAKECLGVFIKELRNIVKNMTVREEHRSIVRGIQANLDHMGTHEENNQNCKTMLRKSIKPFHQFINFVQALNSQP